MTKHRRITGLVAVALLAVAATVANTRSHSPSITDSMVASSSTIATLDFNDRWPAISASPAEKIAR
jgi:hypothetical protein